MNEVGYRVTQRHKWALLAGIFFFGGMIVLSIFAAIVEDPPVIAFALIWMVPLSVSLVALRDIQRGHLYFGPDHVTRLGWRDRILPIQSVRKVKWRSKTRGVKLYSPRGNLTINLDKFEIPDQVKIIHDVRTRCAHAQHLDWPRFCHQRAIKLVDELNAPPHNPTPNRELADGEYIMSRKRYGTEWAVVTAVCSIGWLAFVGLTSTGSWQLNELLASRQLTMQASALAIVPILAAWIGWSFFVWQYPREGRIRKKHVGGEKDQLQIKRAKKFGIPIVLFGAIWTFASYYAFQSFFGFSDDVAVTLAILTLVVILVSASAIGGFLSEEEIKQTDFEPALNRWNEFEQAQLRVRRPRIPGRRQKDQFIIR